MLEIGFGNGEALAWASEHDLARDFIGVEVHGPGVGRLMNAWPRAMPPMCALYQHDAVEVLEHEIATGIARRSAHLVPDPWHKKRHNKRRLIQPAFVELLASRMAPDGLLHLATDWQAYAEHMLEVMEGAPGWRNQLGPGQYAEKPDWRIETHFERRGFKLGPRGVGSVLSEGLSRGLSPTSSSTQADFATWPSGWAKARSRLASGSPATAPRRLYSRSSTQGRIAAA